MQAEVKHCDIAAEKNGRLVVVELKRAFGLKLVYQGLERQSLTDEVFVAIPRPKKGAREKAWQDMLRLLKRLELGLLTVALDSPLKTVDVVLTPADSMIRKNKRKKERLQAELEGRQLDANIGGMTRRKIITAYRERVIRLACILEREGEISLAELRARGLEELAALLSRNYEKWFVRVEKGVYALSEKGKTELKRADYAKVAAYYRQEQLGDAPPHDGDSQLVLKLPVQCPGGMLRHQLHSLRLGEGECRQRGDNVLPFPAVHHHRVLRPVVDFDGAHAVHRQQIVLQHIRLG